jgi:FkbM family methyltransferase
MKAALKKFLLTAGISVQKVPANLPTGHDLGRDLRLVIGSQPGRVCFDVGAHVGDFVDLLRDCLVTPQVHAFEPAPDALRQLRARHGRSPGVIIVPAGLSDQTGRLQFNVFDNQTLNSFLPMAEGAGRTFGGAEQTARIEAPVLRLDDYAAEAGVDRIDLLKIDTQGYELHVLRGASGLLAGGRVGAVLVELNFMPLYAGQVWAHEVIAHLHQFNLHPVDFYEKCRLNPFIGWCTALFAHRP